MKKSIAFLVFMLCLIGIARTQKQSTLKVNPLKKVMELVMPEGDGSNGAGVAWNPVQKTYYAAFAGNTSYPLAVFDAKGNRISKDDLEANFDVRGIWYNSKKETIQMNGYNDFGWAEYSLDGKGLPTNFRTLFEGQHQPDAHSVGAFNNKFKLLYFFNAEGNIDTYDINTGLKIGSGVLYLNCESMEDAMVTKNASEVDSYNKTTVLYTGIKDAELALVSPIAGSVVYYSIQTGLATKLSYFPVDAPINDFLNLAYANEMFWLFDTDNRKWIGYR